MIACFDDELVLGFVEGRLAAPRREDIDEHLDTCDACRTLVGAIARAHDAPLPRGTTLGRYVIGDVLGAGASGRVYGAWDPELDRRVAVKVVRDTREHALREAQAMARLDHPNVVRVHEVGTAGAGEVVFVAMDLVDGVPLRAWMTGRGWREIARALVEIARGLAAVHAVDLVHRDVKPDNIIVDAHGRARLGDFGLARTTAPAAAGAVVGTPVYMAPEVIAGEAASAASDQFALGVTAYEAIAGRRPFVAQDREARVAPLGVGPAWLDAAIRRALARDPAARWPACTEFADALARGLARRTPTAIVAGIAAAAVLASGATYLLAGHAPAAAPPAIAACSLAEDPVADLRAGLRDPQLAGPIDRWLAGYRDARTAGCGNPIAYACLADRGAELHALAARVSDAGPRANAEGTDSPGSSPVSDLDPASARAREGSDRGHVASEVRGPRPEAGGPTGPLLLASLGDALAALPPSDCLTARADGADPMPLDPARARGVTDVAARLPDLRAAIALGDARAVADAMASTVVAARATNHQPTLAAALVVAAEQARAASDLPAAADRAREAFAAALRGHAGGVAAEAAVERVAIAGDRRRLDDAAALADIAAAAIDAAHAPARLATQLARQRALVAYNRGDFATARTLLVDARPATAPSTADRAALESALGTVARAAGDLDEAQARHAEALAIDRTLHGTTPHPDLARDLHDLAGVARLRGDLATAAALYHDALAIEVALRGDASIEAGLTHNSLGLVALARRDYPRAASELALAAAALEHAHHGDLAFVLHNQGLAAAALGDHRAALALYARAAALYTATIGDTAPAPARLPLDRARSELALGQPTAARADLTRAAALGAGTWVADDARALLANRPPPPPTLVVETPLAPPPIPPLPPPPPPAPRRDVGVYGSSQTW